MRKGQGADRDHRTPHQVAVARAVRDQGVDHLGQADHPEVVDQGVPQPQHLVHDQNLDHDPAPVHHRFLGDVVHPVFSIVAGSPVKRSIEDRKLVRLKPIYNF